MGDILDVHGAVGVSLQFLMAKLTRYQQQVAKSTGAVARCLSVCTLSMVVIHGCQVQILASLVVAKMDTKMLKIQKWT